MECLVLVAWGKQIHEFESVDAGDFTNIPNFFALVFISFTSNIRVFMVCISLILGIYDLKESLSWKEAESGKKKDQRKNSKEMPTNALQLQGQWIRSKFAIVKSTCESYMSQMWSCASQFKGLQKRMNVNAN